MFLLEFHLAIIQWDRISILVLYSYLSYLQVFSFFPDSSYLTLNPHMDSYNDDNKRNFLNRS